jgi:hypothetical protein
MFHAISARLARLARRPRSRLAIPFEYAAWHGWQTRKVRPGTWAFRDPRFTHRQIDHAHLSTGCEWCDDKIAGWLDDARADAAIRTADTRTWARDAITRRIAALRLPAHPRSTTGRGA